eukprot:CAMPEP_0115866664 /NCGR_PEP_ID=MMETSP0287-20121206/20367_1 /TAXON_ID=412157 /ORGANISM="Chrysochromulina rotalis, Strain UIO044" /LENGTH=54 /DNA_ID=CAMNT_0003321241 /DNA_START=512 /DNA_END=673 /DNA_ORIENTATION=+
MRTPEAPAVALGGDCRLPTLGTAVDASGLLGTGLRWESALVLALAVSSERARLE